MVDEEGYIVPVSYGRRVDGESMDGSVTRWVLYDRADVEAEYGPLLTPDAKCERHMRGPYECECGNCARECFLEQHGWSPRHGRAGSWFWSEPSVRIVRGRVLVVQFGGYDI